MAIVKGKPRKGAARAPSSEVPDVVGGYCLVVAQSKVGTLYFLSLSTGVGGYTLRDRAQWRTLDLALEHLRTVQPGWSWEMVQGLGFGGEGLGEHSRNE